MRTRTFTLLLLLAAGLPAPSATRASAAGDTELARVGDHVIREKDFIQAYENITPENRPDLTTDDARREFLGNLIHREILLEEAKRRDIEADRAYRLNWEATRRTVVDPALEKILTDRLPSPSPADRRAFEANLAQRYHFHLFMTTDRPTIDAAFQRLEGGQRFAEVEAAWRAQENTEYEDKDTEQAEVIPFEVRDPLFQLQPGEWSAVVELRGVYHLIYLESREPLPVPDQEVLRKRAETTLREDARRRVMDGLVEKAREQEAYQVDDPLARQIARRFRESAGPREVPGRNLAHWPTFTFEDVGKDLATWKTGHLTLDDFLFRLADYPDIARPDLGSERQIHFLREEFSAEVFRMSEAERLGVLEKPEVKRRLTRLRERRLLRTVREVLVSGTEVTDAEVRAFYDQNRAVFRAPAEYHVRVIVRPDSLEALRTLGKLRGGADFAELARTESVHRESAAAGGDLGWITPGSSIYRDIGRVVNQINLNDMSTPVPALGGWAIVNLHETRGARTPDFEDVEHLIRPRLQEEAEDRKLGEWLDARKKEIGVTLNGSRLASIKIPKGSTDPTNSED